MNELTVASENQKLFLTNLRQTTANSHKQLEENYYSNAIQESSVTLHNYQTYIAKLYGIILASENDVFPVLTSLISDIGQRYKADFIVNDLTNTGIPISEVKDLPVYNFTVSSTAQALGIMYVLEGSTLGGKFLYKHINKILGLNAENGASYFWGYGQQTGPLWNNFITIVSNYAVEKNCENEIIASAVQTFSNIDLWLNKAEITW